LRKPSAHRYARAIYLVADEEVAMYQWIARALIRSTLRKHQAGDVQGLMKSYAEDVHFVFPGNNSWATDTRDKAALERWLRRFHAAGLKLEVHDILVGGPPWNTRVCIQFTDHARDADGRVVYENTGVIYGKAKWGKMFDYTVFEDTEKVAAFDEYLEKVGT
jgi:ketosteroid isomerase-like protein